MYIVHIGTSHCDYMGLKNKSLGPTCIYGALKLLKSDENKEVLTDESVFNDAHLRTPSHAQKPL